MPPSAPSQKSPKEKYVSRFGVVEFVLIGGFAALADFFNLITFYLVAPFITIPFTILLRIIFSIMRVKNAAVWIAFGSPTVAVFAVYFLEKAKERSSALAKADQAAAGGGLAQVAGK
jgi:hypothetical protein